MRADCFRTYHAEPEFVAQLAGFCIEIEQDLHVVGNKTDRHDDDVGELVAFTSDLQIVAHVGFQPRLRGWPAAALVDQNAIESAEALGD